MWNKQRGKYGRYGASNNGRPHDLPGCHGEKSPTWETLLDVIKTQLWTFSWMDWLLKVRACKQGRSRCHRSIMDDILDNVIPVPILVGSAFQKCRYPTHKGQGPDECLKTGRPKPFCIIVMMMMMTACWSMILVIALACTCTYTLEHRDQID